MKNRITLLPSHSKSWCISPGIFLFYDEVEIDQNDYVRICNPNSTFDAIAYNNYKKLINNSSFKVITSDLTFYSPFVDGSVKLAEKELKDLFENYSERKENGIITHDEIRLALKHSYKIFIDYNRWKFKMLNKDERLYLDLKENRFTEWSSYLDNLKKIKKYDFYLWLNSRKDLWNVAINLVSVSRKILNSIKDGISIYDPLYEEFRPWINILIKKDIMEFSTMHELSIFEFENLIQFEFNKLAPTSYKKLSFKELLKARQNLQPLRNLLGEQTFIWNDLIATKATAAEQELRKISQHIYNSRSAIPWILYGLCCVVTFPTLSKHFESDYIPFVIAALLGTPILSNKLLKEIEKYSQTFYPKMVPSENKSVGFINVVEKVKISDFNLSTPFNAGKVNFWTK